MITRRVALKQFLVISAGIALLPGCGHGNDKSASYKNLNLLQDDEKLIDSISATILPFDQADNSNRLFVNKMIDDCLTKKEQEMLVAGMNKFTERLKTSGTSFVQADQAKRLSILTALEKELDNKEKPADESLKFFYDTVKRFTVRGYTSSEPYMTTVRHYKMIPGRFKGCVPVTGNA